LRSTDSALSGNKVYDLILAATESEDLADTARASWAQTEMDAGREVVI